MSIHPSLKISGELSGERNVWTRAERIAALRKVGEWQDGDPVLGLPKVRTRFKVKSKKQLKAEAAAAATADKEEAKGDS
ncbi:MAG: small basic protein [Planctomycetota bacterium]